MTCRRERPSALRVPRRIRLPSGKRPAGAALLCLSISLVTLAVAACVLPGSARSDAVELVVRTPTLTLAWDMPARGSPGGLPSMYRVFCKKYGEGVWLEVAEVPASADPTCTLSHKTIGNGLWEFAVQAVGADASASDLHTSLDHTADPLTGWRVLWVNGAN